VASLDGRRAMNGSASNLLFDECYRALAFDFRVQAEVAGIDKLVHHFLTPFRSSRPSHATTTYTIARGETTPFVVYRDGSCVQRAFSLITVADFVLSEVIIEAIERTEDFLVLHAAAASWADYGIVFPAPPDHGKSTLVAGLTRAGFSYLTDEASLIDPATGKLHPFPRALWFEPPTLEMFPEVRERLPAECRIDGRLHYQVRPEDIRPGSIGRPCRIRYVVAPEYRRGSTTTLEPMTRAAAVRMLAENSFNFGSFGDRGLRVLRDVIADAKCYRLYMGDLNSAVSLVEELVGLNQARAAPHGKLPLPSLKKEGAVSS
jgi:hypothetical protein